MCETMRRPLVAVLGATGTGKTKLSVELCQRFNGEVISTDSMQIYNALHIATAKATHTERCGIVHHMLDVVQPTDLGYSVVHFRDKVLNILEDIWSRRKLPVLVGGTNYYIEAILYKTLLPTPSDSTNLKSHRIYSDSTEQLYEKLKSVDPKTANYIHPLRRRQIERALDVLDNHGVGRSELYGQQRQQPGSSVFGGPLRYPDSCLLWLRTPKNILDIRLDARIDAMEKDGLREEIEHFYEEYFQDYQKKMGNLYPGPGVKGDEHWKDMKGLFQSIAVKEFMPFLNLDLGERESRLGEELWKRGIEAMKMGTRRYARKQEQWVRNRLLGVVGRVVPDVFQLDSGDPDQWDALVSNPAVSIIHSYLTQTPYTIKCVDPNTFKGNNMEDGCTRNLIYTCPQCRIYTEGMNQFNAHVTSKRHKKRVNALNKLKINIDKRISQMQRNEQLNIDKS